MMILVLTCLIFSLVPGVPAVVNPHRQSTPSQERVILKQSPFQPHALLYHEIQPLPIWFASSPAKEV